MSLTEPLQTIGAESGLVSGLGSGLESGLESGLKRKRDAFYESSSVKRICNTIESMDVNTTNSTSASIEEPYDEMEIDSRPHKPRIIRVRFGILSAEEIRSMATVSIKETAIFDRNVPKAFGVNDLRMGSVDRRYRCATCSKPLMECVGHTGCIELAFPIYHVGYINTIVKILSSICYFCCTLLVDLSELADQIKEEFEKDTPKQRFQKITRVFKKSPICINPDCCGPQPSYSPSITAHEIGIKLDWKTATARYTKKMLSTKVDPQEARVMVTQLNALSKRPFTAADAAHILTGIDRATCTALGFDFHRSHPRNMILSCLMVPPPITRPAAMTSEGRTRNHDDLTEKLKDIVTANESLKSAIRTATNGESDMVDSTFYILRNKPCAPTVLVAIRDLQYHVSVLFNNDVSSIRTDRQRSGAATKSLNTRLKGKEGRFRANVCGKRVNYSARSVISPDPYLDLDELGVPLGVATVLTFPERVNRWNIGKLTTRVMHGADNVLGARNVIHRDGVHVDLKHAENRDRIHLQYGDIVERYLENNDICIFNRQPSLHKQSMMGHRIRIMPTGRTFRLNLAVVTPYNADFDGDEMNMHVIQSYEGQAEVRELMAVNRNIISPKASKPCIGLIQDPCLGVYFLTRRDSFFTREQVCQLLVQCNYIKQFSLPEPAIRKPRVLWTGKQIISCLFPKVLYYDRWRTDSNKQLCCDPEDSHLVIRHGELLSGRLCKESIGATGGSIHHMIARLYPMNRGSDCASQFISDIQRIANWYLMDRGFSIGIGDNILPRQAQHDIDTSITTITTRVGLIYESMMDKEKFTKAELEPHVYALLRRGLSVTSAIVDKHLSDRNPIWAMVHAGSKGNPVNIGQMTGSLGQQSLDGQRIDSKTPLPGFKNHTRHPCASGFVSESLYDGLRSTGFYHHAMAGREGLVDTAVKTALTGYIQRCLMQALNDFIVEEDDTVRKSTGELLQLKYGTDGWDAASLVRVYMFDIDDHVMDAVSRLVYDWEEYQAICSTSTNEDDWAVCMRDEIHQFIKLHEVAKSTRTSVLRGFRKTGACIFYQPINIAEELDALEHLESHTAFHARSNISLPHLLSTVQSLLRELHDNYGPNILRDYYIRRELSSRIIIMTRRLSLDMLDKIIKCILSRYQQAKVHANEMVGSLSAESMGEPCTQMTLNTFHSTGQLTRVVTTGIPRIKELMFMTKKIRTPSVAILIRNELASSVATFSKWQHLLSELSLESTLRTGTIEYIYDPCPDKTIKNSETDRILVASNALFHDPALPYPHSRWVIRASLDKSVLLDRGLTPKDVARALSKYLQPISHSHTVVVVSETYMEEWIIRIRIPNIYEKIVERPGTEEEGIQLEREICVSTFNEYCQLIRICGIEGIADSSVRKEQGHTIVDTVGSNLLDVWMLDGIDWTLTASNVLHEMQEFLGIEAAAELLFYEMKTVLNMASANISDRHIYLLTTAMTRQGQLVPTNRHGFNRYNAPWAKAAFEETFDNLLESAMFSDVDYMQDLVGNVAVGQTIPAGTGKVRTLLDPDYANRALHEVMPRSTEQVVSTRVHASIDQVIRDFNKLPHSEDPLEDWTPPGDHQPTLPIESSPSTTWKGVHQHRPLYPQFLSSSLATTTSRTQDSTARNAVSAQECKLPAYRPSSPKTAIEIRNETLQIERTLLYRPSSPMSSRDLDLSPRSQTNTRSLYNHDTIDMPDNNDFMLNHVALTEDVELMENNNRDLRCMDPMFTSL